VAERSVVRWDQDKAVRNQVRLNSVARQAAMQSRRCWLPTVRPLATFTEVAALPGSVAADRDGEPPSLEHPTVLVGPEGGWSPAERERLPARVRLGDLVLRAETAAIVASATLSQLRAGLVMVAPSGHRCPEPG
jgi:16S rRNA (uracil1498-N3)-methyltransferase